MEAPAMLDRAIRGSSSSQTENAETRCAAWQAGIVSKELKHHLAAIAWKVKQLQELEQRCDTAICK